MEVRIKEETIPAKTYTVIEYVAKDGKIFNTKEQCQHHEQIIDFENTPLIKNSIQTYTFGTDYQEDCGATLYYINDEEDIHNLVPYSYSYVNGETDFNEHGAGWYICYCVDGGDYADSYYLYHYDTYLNNIKDGLRHYEEKNLRAMMEIYSKQ